MTEFQPTSVGKLENDYDVVIIGLVGIRDDVRPEAKEAIADKLTGNIVKESYVPGRFVNIVMR